MVRPRTMSVVVSELLLTVLTTEETGDLLMYHWSLGAGRERVMVQLSERISPGEAVRGGEGKIRGPEGMAASKSQYETEVQHVLTYD